MKAFVLSIMFLCLVGCSAQIVESNPGAEGGQGGDASTSTVSVATVTSTTTGTTGGGQGGEDPVEGLSLIVEDRTKPGEIDSGNHEFFFTFGIKKNTNVPYEIDGLEFTLESTTGGRLVGTDGANFFSVCYLHIWREPGDTMVFKTVEFAPDSVNPVEQRLVFDKTIAVGSDEDDLIFGVACDLAMSSAELEDEVNGHDYRVRMPAFEDGDILVDGEPLSTEKIDQPEPTMIGAAQTITLK